MTTPMYLAIELGENGTPRDAALSPDGSFVVFNDGDVMQVRRWSEPEAEMAASFDEARLALTGGAVALGPSITIQNLQARFSLADNGSLLYWSGSLENETIVRLGPGGIGALIHLRPVAPAAPDPHLGRHD